MNPGRNDGKHSEAYTPLRSMSASRASMSQAPRRIWSKRVGSKLYSSTGRPTTALNPTLGNSSPSKTHVSDPSAVSITRGARSARAAGIRPSKACRGSTM